MVTPLELPISKPSVFLPRESPAELSTVVSVRARFVVPSMLKTWMGAFLIVTPVIDELVKSWAWKNLGLVLPPLLPSPSQ
jgi:hypothetical protein